MSSNKFPCLQVCTIESGNDEVKTQCEATSLDWEDLVENYRDVSEQPMVRVRIQYSSINYKDALAVNGHPGVAKSLPLVPGIDAAGVVEESTGERFQVGDPVMIFHAKFGTEKYGGYAKYAWVPETWVYPIPMGLEMRETMVIGTAGFTAAQCVDELLRHDVQPDQGEIVVSGATGGVGIFAIKLLAQLGFSVVASTGKADRAEWLRQQGAVEVISREALNDRSGRPLLKSRWAGAVDTVGGDTLETIIRATRGFGCVTACGLAGGNHLSTTVFPFILRGVTLQGIDTANISYHRRSAIWERLANDWRLDGLETLGKEIALNEVLDQTKEILGGRVAGRFVVRL